MGSMSVKILLWLDGILRTENEYAFKHLNLEEFFPRITNSYLYKKNSFDRFFREKYEYMLFKKYRRSITKFFLQRPFLNACIMTVTNRKKIPIAGYLYLSEAWQEGLHPGIHA
jgi:hypothetical protein